MGADLRMVPSDVAIVPLADAETNRDVACLLEFYPRSQWPTDYVDSVGISIGADQALELGALLIAWSDYLTGRPARDWGSLGMSWADELYQSA